MNLDDIGFIRAFLQDSLPIWNVEYDASNRPVYIGKAVRGSANSDKRWIIEKITYDGDNAVTGRLSPQNSIWDDRGSLVYT